MRDNFCGIVKAMLKSRLLIYGLTFAAGAATPIVASAHHAFAAEFDRNQPIDITGSVTKVEWMNPHARFTSMQRMPAANRNWNLEMGSPNGLMRRGWRRDSLKPGDTVRSRLARAQQSACR